MLQIDVSNPTSGLVLTNDVTGSSYRLMGFFYCGVGPKQTFSATYLAPSGNWVRVCTFTKEIDVPTGEEYTYNTVVRRLNTPFIQSSVPQYQPTPRWVQYVMERFPNLGIPPTSEPIPNLIPTTSIRDSGVLNVAVNSGGLT